MLNITFQSRRISVTHKSIGVAMTFAMVTGVAAATVRVSQRGQTLTAKIRQFS